MSFLGRLLLGGGVADGITAIGKILDNLFTSSEEKMSKEAIMEELRQKPHILQAEITKIEAGHRSVFIAGWRPFIGWVCGLGLCFAFLIGPLMGFLGIAAPVFPIEVMYNLVLALIGLGGLRTYEKIKGVDKIH